MRVPLVHLLARNPLPKVSEVMDCVNECAEKIPELVAALIAGNQKQVEELAKEISALEQRADQAKNHLREQLPARIFLAVDRRDVLNLLSQMDAIADCAEDIGVLLTLRRMEVPEEMKKLLHEFVLKVLDVVRTSAKLIKNLDVLMESGFTGKAADQANDLINALRRKEHEADKIQDQIAKVLFTLENNISPVALFMWTKVLSKIGDMANYAENVGDHFRLFTAK